MSLPTLKELGLESVQMINGTRERVRDKPTWAECDIQPAPSGLQIFPRKSFADAQQWDHQTLFLVREICGRANDLGYDAWMCNNDPTNGGFIQEKKDEDERTSK